MPALMFVGVHCIDRAEKMRWCWLFKQTNKVQRQQWRRVQQPIVW